VFATGASETAAEKMRIASDGKVGIGTSAPASLIHLHNSGASYGDEVAIRGTTSDATPKAEIAFKRGTSGVGAGIVFRPSNSSGTLIDAMLIDDDTGNVGIGTTAPDSLIHVSGAGSPSIRVTDTTNTITGKFQADDSSAKIGTHTNHNFGIFTNNTARMTIDTSGYVGIGTTAPDVPLYVATATVNVGQVIQGSYNNNANPNLTIQKSNGSIASPTAITSGHYAGQIRFNSYDGNSWHGSADIVCVTSGTVADGRVAGNLTFRTAPDSAAGVSEAMRITSAGYVGINTTSPTTLLEIDGATSNSTADAHVYIKKSTNDDWTLKFEHDGYNYGLQMRGEGTHAIYVVDDNGSNPTAAFRVEFDGSIYTSDTSIHSISDRRLKENIVDANSQWDDIKALQFKNFNWKEETGRHDKKLLGLIADEVETVSPKLVTIDAQPKEDMDAGIPDPEYKAVMYSVVWMKAAKALQEAMAKIETLETKVTALENA
jgi:hypothetical protein